MTFGEDDGKEGVLLGRGESKERVTGEVGGVAGGRAREEAVGEGGGGGR